MQSSRLARHPSVTVTTAWAWQGATFEPRQATAAVVVGVARPKVAQSATSGTLPATAAAARSALGGGAVARTTWVLALDRVAYEPPAGRCPGVIGRKCSGLPADACERVDDASGDRHHLGARAASLAARVGARFLRGRADRRAALDDPPAVCGSTRRRWRQRTLPPPPRGAMGDDEQRTVRHGARLCVR